VNTTQAKFCDQCGTKKQSTSKFCPNCGRAFGQPQIATNTESPSSVSPSFAKLTTDDSTGFSLGKAMLWLSLLWPLGLIIFGIQISAGERVGAFDLMANIGGYAILTAVVSFFTFVISSNLGTKDRAKKIAISALIWVGIILILGFLIYVAMVGQSRY
jgi:hypothetical protein